MVSPLILGLPYTVAAGILCGRRISRNLSTPNEIVCSVSFVPPRNIARSLAGFVLLALELTLKHLYSMKSLNPLCPSSSHFTGTSAGAPLSLIKTTRNFAGWVPLAFRSTT
jgi:hypothetical protein